MNNLLEANLWFVLFYSIYWVIKNKLKYGSRRLLLLSLPFLSVLVVMISSYLQNNNRELASVITLKLDLIDVSNTLVANEQTLFTLENIYWAGVCLFAVLLVVKLKRIILFFKKIDFEQKERYKVYTSQKADSFSFFNKIHLNNEHTPELGIVEEHERVHVMNNHTREIMIVEFFKLFFWFNPLIYLMMNELKKVQEYQVDTIMYDKYEATYIQSLVHYSLKTQSEKYLLTSQFYSQLSLTQRIKIMKKKTSKQSGLLLIIPILALMLSLVSWSKSPVKGPVINNSIEENDSIVRPTFKGGQEALFQFISKNVQYPEKAKSKNIEGIVFVGFTITKEGKVTKINVKRKVNEELEKEAIRVIKSMPDWNPGTKDGKKVNIEMVVPISFKMK